MSQFKILVGRVLVDATAQEWSRWFEDSAARIVGKTKVGGVEVSTVCLGMDHDFLSRRGGLWFETMIFDSEDFGGRQWRYSTYDEAERGHARVVEALTTGLKP